MKRSAALDFLRGAAAFAVAIPHYLTANAPFQPFAEAFAIAGVEVFFVLSGFVLAPQIVDWVVAKPWRNLGVFLVRRWMRTIPPYVVALIVIAVLTGNLMTADFLRYLFYVENLFSSANHVDFYPVAWSLAIEEWFYLLFAPALFLVARLLRKTRPPVRGDLRGPRHSDCCGAAVLDCAARLGPQCPAGHAVSHRLDRLGLLALSRARAPSADRLGRRLRPGASGPVARAAWRRDSRRARRRHHGRRGRRLRSACVSLRLGGVRHDRGRRALAGRGPVPQSRRQRRKLLPRPRLLLGLSLPPHRHHGAEADARDRAAPAATDNLRARDACAVDDLLRRIRAADPGGAALLRRGASRGRGDCRPAGRAMVLAPLAAHRWRLLSPRSPAACSPATRSWPTSPMRSIRFLSRPRSSSLRSPSERVPIQRARSPWRRAPSSCLRWRCRSPMVSTAARPACLSSRRSRRRPIPIAPRTPIRRRSPPGGSTISTNGSGTTG